MILAFDLGTGGVKASLVDESGRSHGAFFQAYPTFYGPGGRHEQRPEDWWAGVCAASRSLLSTSGFLSASVEAVALSGFSMTAVPLDAQCGLLMERVPIWSDARATDEARRFFERVDYGAWYRATGSGDPPELYPLMKLMWLEAHHPEVAARTALALGSKDYINLRLTGAPSTDYSYASGSGAFDMRAFAYRRDFLEAAGVPGAWFPEPAASHERVGRITKEAAAETGLREGTPVMLGGVDNALMALGTTGFRLNQPYTSLGSSAWIAVTSEEPVLDEVSRPFIFAFVEKGLYTSGVSIFAAGSAYRWAGDMLCSEVPGEGRLAFMDALAGQSPAGANGVRFNPTLAGASPQEPGPLQGAFGALTLAATRGDLLRAVLEGVAMSLDAYCLKALERRLPLAGEMLLTGGGGKSPLWMRIFAGVYGMPIRRSLAGQEAASRGAAMVALRGLGAVKDYRAFDGWLGEGEEYRPDAADAAAYAGIKEEFARWTGGGASPAV